MSDKAPLDPIFTEARVNEPAAGAEFKAFDGPASGWGALQATAKALREQSVAVKGSKAAWCRDQERGCIDPNSVRDQATRA